jgi:hypothetical protein
VGRSGLMMISAPDPLSLVSINRTSKGFEEVFEGLLHRTNKRRAIVLLQDRVLLPRIGPVLARNPDI